MHDGFSLSSCCGLATLAKLPRGFDAARPNETANNRARMANSSAFFGANHLSGRHNYWLIWQSAFAKSYNYFCYYLLLSTSAIAA
jgi:hypothetical protein